MSNVRIGDNCPTSAIMDREGQLFLTVRVYEPHGRDATELIALRTPSRTGASRTWAMARGDVEGSAKFQSE